MATYSIKDLEKISGIKAHTIRIWEKRYGLVIPNRTQTNIRYYSDAELRKLLNISILARNGIKISKIAGFNNEEICEKVLLFSQKNNNTETIIENLVIAMVELDEYKFDYLLSNHILKLGFEETFIRILHPFFQRVGILWQAGTIVPAQEHFISNLVRQKLIVAIDSLQDQVLTKQNRFVLFLPEGELHELGLLFYQYTLRKRGFKTLYFGQTLPIRDLEKICETQTINFLLTNITATLPTNRLKELIFKLADTFPTTTICISSPQIPEIVFETPINVLLIGSPADFIRQVESYS